MLNVSWASSVSGHVSLSALVAAYENFKTVLVSRQLHLWTPCSSSEGVRFTIIRVIPNSTKNQTEKAWQLSKYTHAFCSYKWEYNYINLGMPRLDLHRSQESGIRFSPEILPSSILNKCESRNTKAALNTMLRPSQNNILSLQFMVALRVLSFIAMTNSPN